MSPAPARVSGTDRGMPAAGLVGTPMGTDRSAYGHPGGGATSVPGNNQRYSLTVNGTPTAGNFTLRAVAESGNIDVTTGAIAYNAALAAVQTALDNALGAGMATATGGPLPGAVTIDFGGILASQTVTLTVAAENITGGDAVVGLTQAATPGTIGIGDPVRRAGGPRGNASSRMARPRGLGRP